MPTNETHRSNVAIVGCGYVGSALGQVLVRAGHDVLGTTTTAARTRGIAELGIRPLVVELTDKGRLHEALLDRHAVVLCVGAGRGGDYHTIYLEGIRSLLRAVADTSVRRIVYTSSSRVYGQNDGRWVDEDSPVEPSDENGRILLEAERVLLDGVRTLNHCAPSGAALPSRERKRPVTNPRARAWGSDRWRRIPHGDSAGVSPVRATVLRLGGIHGPDRDIHARIRSAAGQARSDGEAYLNLIHRDDVVMALTLLLDSDHEGVLNLCDDHPETRQAFYDRVIAAADLAPIRWTPTTSPGQANLGKRVRNDLIKRTLGIDLMHPKH